MNLNNFLNDFSKYSETFFGREKLLEFLTIIDKNPTTWMNEGLIQTYNPEKIENYVKREYKLEDWQYRIIDNRPNGTRALNIVTLPGQRRIERLSKEFDNRFGWYLTHEFDWEHPTSKKKYKVLEFRSKFSDNSKAQEEVEKNPILWHATTYASYQKILKRGFIPKSRNKVFKYPDKVHFLIDRFSINDVIEFCKKLRKYSDHKLEDWVILKVDVRSAGREIARFYWDPDFEGSVFTYENIFPSDIKVVETIKPDRKMSLQETIEYVKQEMSKLDFSSSF